MASWFKNLAITRKLLLSFGAVLLLMGGALAADVAASRRQADLTSRIVDHLHPARLNALNIVTLVRAADDDGAWAQGARHHLCGQRVGRSVRGRPRLIARTDRHGGRG